MWIKLAASFIILISILIETRFKFGAASTEPVKMKPSGDTERRQPNKVIITIDIGEWRLNQLFAKQWRGGKEQKLLKNFCLESISLTENDGNRILGHFVPCTTRANKSNNTSNETFPNYLNVKLFDDYTYNTDDNDPESFLFTATSSINSTIKKNAESNEETPEVVPRKLNFITQVFQLDSKFSQKRVDKNCKFSKLATITTTRSVLLAELGQFTRNSRASGVPNKLSQFDGFNTILESCLTVKLKEEEEEGNNPIEFDSTTILMQLILVARTKRELNFQAIDNCTIIGNQFQFNLNCSRMRTNGSTSSSAPTPTPTSSLSINRHYTNLSISLLSPWSQSILRQSTNSTNDTDNSFSTLLNQLFLPSLDHNNNNTITGNLIQLLMSLVAVVSSNSTSTSSTYSWSNFTTNPSKGQQQQQQVNNNTIDNDQLIQNRKFLWLNQIWPQNWFVSIDNNCSPISTKPIVSIKYLLYTMSNGGTGDDPNSAIGPIWIDEINLQILDYCNITKLELIQNMNHLLLGHLNHIEKHQNEMKHLEKIGTDGNQLEQQKLESTTETNDIIMVTRVKRSKAKKAKPKTTKKSSTTTPTSFKSDQKKTGRNHTLTVGWFTAVLVTTLVIAICLVKMIFRRAVSTYAAHRKSMILEREILHTIFDHHEEFAKTRSKILEKSTKAKGRALSNAALSSAVSSATGSATSSE